MLRDDHETHIGGDLVQLRETVAALCRRGMDAVATTLADAPDNVDIVHLYNIQLPERLTSAYDGVRLRWPGARVIVSPILPMTALAAFRTKDPLTMRKVARALAGDALRSIRTRRVMRSADAVIANTPGELAALRRWCGVRRGEVVPNGVAIDRWPARTGPVDRASTARRFGFDPNAAPIVACIGRLEPLKNQRTLIRAVDRLPGAALVLIGPEGDPVYSASVKADARERSGRVALAGGMAQAEIASLLANVDVHVLPSFRESFSLANLEAGACGCEIVAARASWTRERLGEAAAYADMASPASIAAAIDDVMQRPRQPRVRELVATFDWSTAAQALEECYRRVRSEERGGAPR